MRAAIINNLPGSYGTIANQAIWDKVTTYQLTRLYADPRQLAAVDVDYIHSRGIEAGIELVPGWLGSLDPATFAQAASVFIDQLLASSKQLSVLFDIETHDISWITQFVGEWRKRRPTRNTVISFEPFQGGLEPIQILEAASFRLAPQLYFGDMSPAAADRVAIDLIQNGATPANISSVYDGARLPGRWDGIVFTLERLP